MFVCQDCLSCPESRPPDFASRQGKSNKTTFLHQLCGWFAFEHVHNSMDSVYHSKVYAFYTHIAICWQLLGTTYNSRVWRFCLILAPTVIKEPCRPHRWLSRPQLHDHGPPIWQKSFYRSPSPQMGPRWGLFFLASTIIRDPRRPHHWLSQPQLHDHGHPFDWKALTEIQSTPFTQNRSGGRLIRDSTTLFFIRDGPKFPVLIIP